MHWGINYAGTTWQTPDNVYWPSGSYLFNGSGPAVETPFNGPDAENNYTLDIGPFNDPVQEVNSIAFVIHFQNDTWDNNNGNDYHINFSEQGIIGVEWQPQNPTQYDSVWVYVGQAMQGAHLHWGVRVNGNNWQTPNVAYWPAGSYLFNGSGPAIESAFSGPDAENILSIGLSPFNDPSQEVEGINFVIHYNDNSWDNNYGNDYFIPITYIDQIELDVRVFLEGPFNGYGMNSELSEISNFPLQQPYTNSPWNYNGLENINEIPEGTVDWVLLELRDASSASLASSSTRIDRKAALLMNNGFVRSVDGISNPLFEIANIENSLFVVIYHRNHLPVISANPLHNMGSIFNYDFTQSMEQAFNNGLKNLGGEFFGMYAGEAEANSLINSEDNIIWTSEAGTKGYNASDYDLSGQVNNMDKNDFWLPNSGIGSQVPD